MKQTDTPYLSPQMDALASTAIKRMMPTLHGAVRSGSINANARKTMAVSKLPKCGLRPRSQVAIQDSLHLLGKCLTMQELSQFHYN